MLIFDNFPTRERAEAFAANCKKVFGLDASVFDSQEESNKVDIFPYELNPPIVLVERTYLACNEDGENTETRVINSVDAFNGVYAGT